MKIIDRYMGSNVLLTTVFGLVFLSFVLVVGNVVKEVLDLVINRNVPLGPLVYYIFLVMPFSLSFTIPWAFLVSVLLFFGRISADNELAALQFNGVSLPRLCVPVFVLSLVLSGICLFINAEVAPRAEARMRSIVDDLRALNPVELLQPDEVIEEVPHHLIYIGGKEEGTLKNIIIFELDDEQRPQRMITAKEASLSPSPHQPGALLNFRSARFEHRDKSDPLDFNNIQMGLKIDQGAYLLAPGILGGSSKRPKSIRTYTLQDLLGYMASGAGGKMLQATVECHRRLAISLACVTFALIGIPLGITTQRRETSIGFGISLAVGFTYFLAFIIALKFEGDPGAHPVFVIWLGNIVFGLIGAGLFIRLARR